LARVLSKLGYCSRKQAGDLIRAGKVKVNGVARHDPEWPVDTARDQLAVEEQPVRQRERVYLALNKPRGLVTTRADEKGRATVFECLAELDLPMVMPVGRLDQASEGLLLFTNDTEWAARITDPSAHLDKTYHVQVNRLVDEAFCLRLLEGARIEGELLRVKGARVLRQGARNCWLELILDEGKNRHIRRLLGAFDLEVLRLVRVKIGPLELGSLPKGETRPLTDAEVRALGGGGGRLGAS
jgi:23S rRNA pseudouridine2605 synthase